jgi:SAM-dependent methyltransferase
MGVFESFTRHMKPAYQKENLARVHTKYHDLQTLFKRFYKPLRNLKKLGLKRGLDFGCGTCGAVVVGKLLGIEIVGLDLDFQREDVPGGEGECCYKLVQDKLREQGFPIVNRNTNRFPWKEFKASEFDFVLSYYGLNKNFAEARPGDYKGKLLDRRWQELARVTAPKGLWVLYPHDHIQLIKASPSYAKYIEPKSISLVKFG